MEEIKKVCTGHIINCKFLNIRSEPTINSGVLCVLDGKSIFKILDKRDPIFYKIEYKNNIGYCMKQFVEEN